MGNEWLCCRATRDWMEHWGFNFNKIMRIKETLNEILVKHTGQPVEVIRKDTDRNFFMDVTEAKAYGIIDEILTKREK